MFVYGTLKEGHCWYENILKGKSKRVGEAMCVGRILGNIIPFMVIPKDTVLARPTGNLKKDGKTQSAMWETALNVWLKYRDAILYDNKQVDFSLGEVFEIKDQNIYQRINDLERAYSPVLLPVALTVPCRDEQSVSITSAWAYVIENPRSMGLSMRQKTFQVYSWNPILGDLA